MKHHATNLITFALATSVAAQAPTRLVPAADATVRSDQPTTNFGKSTELGLAKNKNGAGRIYFMRTHFRFDVTALKGKAPVSKATLYFNETRTIAAGGLPVAVYRLTSGFTETTVTWNRKPSDDGRIVSQVPVGNNFNRGFKKFDVTTLVRGWVAGAFANHGLVIRLPRESTAGAYRPGWGPSREHATVAARPYLLVETNAVRIFDRGCGPVATWPRLRVTAGTPKIGTKLTVTGSLLGIQTASITAVGLSNTTWMGVKLPFMIDPNVGPPCQLLVGPDVLIPGRTTARGQQSWSFPVPNDQRIRGVKVYMQMATAGRPSHMTDGLELTIY